MILTQAQAEAVYSAMCALNSVGGRLSLADVGVMQRVRQSDTGCVIVESIDEFADHYPNQYAFASDYGLQQG